MMDILEGRRLRAALIDDIMQLSTIFINHGHDVNAFLCSKLIDYLYHFKYDPNLEVDIIKETQEKIREKVHKIGDTINKPEEMSAIFGMLLLDLNRLISAE